LIFTSSLRFRIWEGCVRCLSVLRARSPACCAQVGRTHKGAGGYRSRHACSRVRRAPPGPSRSSPSLCNRVSGLLCSRLYYVLVALLEGVGLLLFPVRSFLSVCSLVAVRGAPGFNRSHWSYTGLHRRVQGFGRSHLRERRPPVRSLAALTSPSAVYVLARGG
jgi:hypothetical protein